MTEVAFFCPGAARPQGSKRAITYRRDDGTLGARTLDAAKGLKEWRGAIAMAARRVPAGRRMTTGGVHVGLVFHMPPPKNLPKRKDVAMTRRPDIDKLTRAALDALTGVCYTDDSCVVSLHVRKQWAATEPGVAVVVRPADLPAW